MVMTMLSRPLYLHTLKKGMTNKEIIVVEKGGSIRLVKKWENEHLAKEWSNSGHTLKCLHPYFIFKFWSPKS